MSAQKVLDRLEQMGILDPKVIGELRRFLEEAKYTVTPEAIVKLLVDKRQLTPFQAKKLITDVYGAEKAKAAPANPTPPPPQAIAVSDDELLLADEPTKVPAQPAPAKTTGDDEILDLEEALPPTPETPIKATIKSTPSPPVQETGERKKIRRPPVPVPPKSITTDDLISATPLPKRPAPKPAAPPPPTSKQPVANEIDSQTVPGLMPIDTPPPPLRPAKSSASGSLNALDTPGLTPLTALGPATPPALPGLFDAAGGLSPLGASGDPLEGLGPDVLSAEPPPPPKPEKIGINKKKAGTWDSVLMMVGGGLLGVLVITFAVLYFALANASSSEVFDKATEAYREGQYPTAQLRYEEFVKKFPQDANASIAKVRVGMAKFRQVYDGAKDYSQALKVAKDVLPTIENEKNFDDTARPDLAVMLPNIAESFAKQAVAAAEMPKMQRFVDLANDAMTLVNNPTYLPSTRRKDQQPKIDEILEHISVAQRRIHQDQALIGAMKRLEEKLASGDTIAAHEVRDELLRQYPVLETNPDVKLQTIAISKKEGEIITSADVNQSAISTERFASSMGKVTLANLKEGKLPNADGQICTVLVRGAVYAVEVATGKVKWRRYVGQETKTTPLLLPSGDFLVSDERAHDLLRVARESGKLVWRQALDEPFAAPVLRGEQIIISLRSGRIAQINAADGTFVRIAKLPQKLSVAAGIDAKNNRLYQVADRSTLFQMSMAEAINQPLALTQAIHLGHKPGTIAVPPVVVMGYVFVCENAGADYSRLHMLGTDEEGKLISMREEPLRIRGRVIVPASSSGKRFVVMTDLGEVLVFNVDPSNAANPITQIAKLVGNYTQSTLGYHALDGNKLITAEKRFTEYEVLSTRETLDRKKSSFDGDTFLGPLQAFGRNLVHVRKRANSLGVTVSGVNLDSPAQTWQLDLSTPNAASFAFPEKKLFTAISASGELYEVSMADFQEGWRDQPTETTAATRIDLAAIALSKNRYLLRETSGTGWLLYSPAEKERLKFVQASKEPVASTTLVPFGDGLLAANNNGMISWLDPLTGKPFRNATPFQPPLGPEAKIRWLPPVALDDKQFVAINADMKTVHLVRREEKPELYLTESRKLELDREPLSAAVLGNVLLLAVRGEMADELRIFSLPGLEAQGKIELADRLTKRGVEVVGSGFTCETSRGELLRMKATGELAWKVPYADSPVVGTPVMFGSDLLLVGQAGKLSVVKEATGEMQPGSNLGEPLLGTPQVIGPRVLVSGYDGTLHILPILPPAETK